MMMGMRPCSRRTLQTVEAVAVGQREVEQDQVGRELTRMADGEVPVRDQFDLKPFEGQVVAHHPSQCPIVFHDEDSLLHHSLSKTGNVTDAVVPVPGVL